MWLSRPIRTASAAIGLTAFAVVVSGCSSFTPVYGDAAEIREQLDLAFPKPESRLEQIVYQELALRFGSGLSTTASLVSATVLTSNRDIAVSDTDDPFNTREMTVTVVITITPPTGDANEAITLTRRATATYLVSGQILANEASVQEAQERATRSATESLRLAILASFGR